MTATTPETTVETLPYKNPDLPASERIADLLSRMTLEEKVGQMMQLDARGGDLDELIVNKHVGSICFASMFVRQVRQCFSAVWADGFPRCRHRFPVM